MYTFLEKNIVLVGAGGHAKVVYDAIKTINLDTEISIYDNQTTEKDFFNLKTKHISKYLDQIAVGETVFPFHVAIGDNQTRKEVYADVINKHSVNKFRAMNKSKTVFCNIIHPNADVSIHANITEGALIGSGAIVAACSEIGIGSIINHGAIIDHDCRIGAWTHIAPNATLGGNVTIGEGTLVGAGAVILPGIKVGDWSIIGAGAVVTHGVEANQTIVGIPGRQLKS